MSGPTFLEDEPLELIEVNDLVHRFRKYDQNGDAAGFHTALKGVSFNIEEGSFVCVLGRNASGKSTLAKHLNALLLPSEGTVFVCSMDTRDEKNDLNIRKNVGMVFQNPDNQIVSSVIEEDVAFGPENLGVPTTELESRVTESLNRVGMKAYRYHSPNKLSGGQKQRIAIAGVLAMKPKCIIMDEATSMLDPRGRREVLEAVHELNKKEGISIILITHYMEEAVDADRVLVMDKGEIVMDGRPEEIFARDKELESHGLTLPDVTALGNELKAAGLPLNCPVLTEEELKTQLLECLPEADKTGLNDISSTRDMSEKIKTNLGVKAQEAEATEDSETEDFKAPQREVFIELKNVSYTYSAGTPYEVHALKDVSCKIYKGSITGLVGHTGSGKSTLLQLLNGLLEPEQGQILLCSKDIWRACPSEMASGHGQAYVPRQARDNIWKDEETENPEASGKKRKRRKKEKKKHHIKELTRRVGLVFQYPEYQLFEESVIKDVCFGPKNLGLSAAEAKERAFNALKMVGIDEELFYLSPFELSGGQKRRVAIAGILAMEPDMLVLDEPTAGLDPKGRFEILDLLKRLNQERGMTILLVSHSMEDIAEYCENMLVLNDAEVMYDGTVNEVFSHRKELTDMGLGVTCVSRITGALRDAGKPCQEVLTVEEAATAIKDAYFLSDVTGRTLNIDSTDSNSDDSEALADGKGGVMKC